MRPKGFTLFEMMVVLCIIGVIAGLLVGLCYWLLCDRDQPKQFFSDFQLFSSPDQAYVDDDK